MDLNNVGVINGKKCRIRLLRDFRGGANAELLAKKGDVLTVKCVSPAPGFTGYSGFTVKKVYGTWCIPDYYAEIVGEEPDKIVAAIRARNEKTV